MSDPPSELFGLTTAPVAVGLGLLDDDGRFDMVTLESNGDLSVTLNNGDDTWRQVKLSSLDIENASGMGLGLVNADAYLDVVVQGEDEIVVALGDGAGSFTASQTLTPVSAGDLAVPGGGEVSLFVGMLNGDSISDLAVVVPVTDEVLVYLGQTTGQFGTPTSYSSGGTTPVRLVSGDFLGDVSADLAVAHTDGSVTFLEGDASGALVLRTGSTVSGLGNITGLSTADVDEDGQSDLVVSSASSVKVLINPDDPLPTSPIVNGDFQLGLTSWTVTPDSVSADAGVAQLRESSSQLLSSLEQTFIVPSDAETLSFDLVALGLQLPTSGLADAFEVSLLDANSESLVPTFRSEATSFYNVGPDGTESLATGVSRTGDRITVDLSGLTAETPARIVFDLIGNPAGTSSAVSIDNVSVVPQNVWGTAFTTVTVPGPFSGVTGLVTADVDGNGHVVVIVSDQTAEELIVAYGDGTGSFTRWTYDLSTYGSGAGPVAAAPLVTGDTVPEVVVALAGASAVLTPLDYEAVVESDIFRVPGSPGEPVLCTSMRRSSFSPRELVP